MKDVVDLALSRVNAADLAELSFDVRLNRDGQQIVLNYVITEARE